MIKNALIIVPHQDDETNLAGNIIDVIKSKYELYVLYSSLDTDKKRGNIRKHEAINACAVWGIPESNIIFLNYPDTANSAGEHWYYNDSKGVIGVIKSHILRIRPSMIFATDFDYHSDHRMLSLAFDTAMGQILRQKTDYKPIVLKGFCYETSYYGLSDFKASNTGVSLPSLMPLSNPAYEWDKRLSIEGKETTGFIWRRKAYKALANHKSQYAILHARSIINSDNVFWQRKTDNLLFSANLTSSAPEFEKVRDFLVLDTNDIVTANPRKIDYSCSCCIFEKDGWLSAKWNSFVVADRIILHGCINDSNDVETEIMVYLDGNKISNIEKIHAYGRDTEIVFEKQAFKEMRLSFIGKDTALSEIEVIEHSESALIELSYDSKPGKSNRFVDLIDYYIYMIIVVYTKAKRKIRNILKTK